MRRRCGQRTGTDHPNGPLALREDTASTEERDIRSALDIVVLCEIALSECTLRRKTNTHSQPHPSTLEVCARGLGKVKTEEGSLAGRGSVSTQQVPALIRLHVYSMSAPKFRSGYSCTYSCPWRLQGGITTQPASAKLKNASPSDSTHSIPHASRSLVSRGVMNIPLDEDCASSRRTSREQKGRDLSNTGRARSADLDDYSRVVDG